MGLIFVCLVWAIGVFVYFAPAIVASQRQHPSKTSILVVNLFLGWLLIPWVVCLAWALGNIEQVAPAESEAVATPPQLGMHRPCPFCAEQIRVEAIKCKHCGSKLPAPSPGGM